MTTNSTTRNPLKWLFRYEFQYVLAFFIPALILFVCYMCFGVYPASNESVLSLDLNAQYIYYFDYMHDVFAGKESLFYSWSRNLSGEFVGIIGYYLASPFSFIVWLFPRAHITEGMLTMILVKVGTIGVTTSIYLSRGRGFSKGTSVIFSMMFALCSFTMVQTMNPMWLDGMIALPLVVYGVESLIRKGRFRMLILSLVYSFVTCFYIGYMIGIFAAIYFFYFAFASHAYGRLDGGQILARMGLFLISAITAVMSSCFMLVPVVNSLSLGKFSFSDPDYSVVNNFTLFDLFGKLLPNSYDTVRMEGLPFLYCGTLALIMAICYFFLPKILRRARISSGFLLLVMVACMYIRPVDMMWHGGQMPNWLPYRYSFIISFLLVIFGAEAFDNIKHISRKQIGIVGGAIIGIALLLGTMDSHSEALNRETLPELTVIAPAIVIVALLTAVLIQTKPKLNVRVAATVTLAILVGAEVSYNTIMALVKQDIDIVYSSRDTYVNFMVPTRQKVDEIIANDSGFYRIEKNFNRSANDPIGLRMYGLTHSSSTLNDKPISLLGEFGMTSRGHYTKYNGATPIIDDLFGVKYILSCPSNEYHRITGKEDITVEENLDAMPIMYLTDPLLAEYRFAEYRGDDINVFQKQNRLLSHMLGDTYANPYFKTIPEETLELETENVSEGKTGAHTTYSVITSGKNAQLKYTVTAQEEGEIFMWLPSDYERKLNVWLNTDEWKGNYFETENYNAKSLGVFEKGETFTVTLTLTDDKVYFKKIIFGYLDQELYNEAYGTLRAMNEGTVVTKLSPTVLVANVTAEDERLLLTTIPVEPGWTVTVDGKLVEPLEIMDALIGVMLPPGTHKIEMQYTVPDYAIALGLTGGGILLFVLLCLVSWRVRKKYGEYDYGEPQLVYDDADGDPSMLDAPEDDFLEYDPDRAEQQIEDILFDLNEINDDEAFFEEPVDKELAEPVSLEPLYEVAESVEEIEQQSETSEPIAEEVQAEPVSPEPLYEVAESVEEIEQQSETSEPIAEEVQAEPVSPEPLYEAAEPVEEIEQQAETAELIAEEAQAEPVSQEPLYEAAEHVEEIDESVIEELAESVLSEPLFQPADEAIQELRAETVQTYDSIRVVQYDENPMKISSEKKPRQIFEEPKPKKGIFGRKSNKSLPDIEKYTRPKTAEPSSSGQLSGLELLKSQLGVSDEDVKKARSGESVNMTFAFLESELSAYVPKVANEHEAEQEPLDLATETAEHESTDSVEEVQEPLDLATETAEHESADSVEEMQEQLDLATETAEHESADSVEEVQEPLDSTTEAAEYEAADSVEEMQEQLDLATETAEHESADSVEEVQEPLDSPIEAAEPAQPNVSFGAGDSYQSDYSEYDAIFFNVGDGELDLSEIENRQKYSYHEISKPKVDTEDEGFYESATDLFPDVSQLRRKNRSNNIDKKEG